MKYNNQASVPNSSGNTMASAGFALIATVSVMVLLVLIALAMLSLSTVELRSSRNEDDMNTARANARMGLMIAIGELQKMTGPDQRITASADILAGSMTLAEGRGHWTGVWDTSNYDPSDPSSKPFLNWLVSSPDTGVNSALSSVSGTSSSDDLLIFEGEDDATSVRVPRVAVGNGAYAYWVEDESVKADLSWYEGEFDNDERKQAARLAAAPGVDYQVFEGPFSGQVTYPLEFGVDNEWLEDVDKAVSSTSMPLVIDSASNGRDWLRQHRHDITFGTRGVMTDVKEGGLRRDLSLAFEMDGEADMVTATVGQPTRFNEQFDEFVSDSPEKDRLAASGKPNGLPVYERFVYRDYRDASPATPFSGDIVSGDNSGDGSIVRKRGPNWWALRDYANLYKRLRGANGDYTLDARTHYPNKKTEGRNFSEMFDTVSPYADHWDHEQRTQLQGNFSGYIYRPAEPSYAPVSLGTSILLSLKGVPATSGGKIQLAVAVDPIFYIWNPYNRRLRFEGMSMSLRNSFPGQYNIKITGSDSQTINGYVRDLFQNNVNTEGRTYSFEVQDSAGSSVITMEPGEVMAVTPSSANTGIAKPGYFDEGINESGLIMTEIDGNGSSVEIDATANANKVSFGYSSQATASTDRYYLNTSILNTSDASAPESEEILQSHFQVRPTSDGGFRTPGTEDFGYIIPGSEIDAIELVTGEKKFFGMLTHLMKPALFGGGTGGEVDAGALPAEVFSRFNPAPMLINKDFWRACTINQFYSHIADDNINNLLNNYGFNFTGSGRNAFWGSTYQFGGSTSVPMSNIPSRPLISLAEFSHANLSTLASEPFHAVGNSWSSPLITPTSPYQSVVVVNSPSEWTVGDHSWLMNDALFDRYYLSGIAPTFSIGNSGYSRSGSIRDTLTKFYSESFQDAQSNHMLRPYLPNGKSATEIVSELNPDAPDNATDGYMKIGAYSMIHGAFNVNSTSVLAWQALLRANRGLEVNYAQGAGSDASDNDTPFPSSVSPSNPNGSSSLMTNPHWAGLARLDDGEIEDLAEEIVKQVKLRGPFMGLSDFINHSMGPLNDETSYTGALQAAIDLTSINDNIQSQAGGATPDYSSKHTPSVTPTSILKKSTTGIPSDLTQAALLIPLAPRLTARSDTFRIRSYGETRSADGNTVTARAYCEAVLQRIPEYLDPNTNPDENEPWDQAINPITLAESSDFNDLNKTFGRRYKLVQFRWISPDEITTSP